jgi:hypothetical protein
MKAMDVTDASIAGEEPAANLSRVLISLLRGVLYRENEAALWQDLLLLQARVRDYIAVLGLALLLDESEGYAYLYSRPAVEGEVALPRLLQRRALSFPVSLLLALLRKKLAEFDAGAGTEGSSSRLMLSRDDIVELVRVFLPSGSNETRLIDQVDTHINKIIDLGFLRKLKSQNGGFEVRRILKAYVDAQWLAEFDQRLAAYQVALVGDVVGDVVGNAVDDSAETAA